MSFGFGNNNSTGFGSSNTGGGGFGGFGTNNNTSTSASLFGGNTATSGGGGFGGFGSSNTTSNAFGAKSTGGFGAPATTSSGGLFGSTNNNTSTTGGFGGSGFGGTTASTGFGTSNTSGGKSKRCSDVPSLQVANDSKGLFGANKPATGFGSTATAGSLFGGNNNNNNNVASGGFGSAANTSNAFGASSSNNNTTNGFGVSSTGGGFGGGSAFGASTSVPMSNQGSAAVPFQAFSEKDGATSGTSSYQSLAFQEPYKNQSFEELRTQDYLQGRRFGNSNGQAGSFGQSTGFGGFGASNSAANTGGGLFGGNNNNPTAAGGTGGFGGFGSNNAASNTIGGFGASGGSGGGLFGVKAAGGLFGGGAASTGTTAGGFGSTPNTGGGLFANNNNANTTGGFGSTNTGGGMFGSTTNNTGGGFGASNNNAGGSLFGSTDQSKVATTNLFGATNNNNNNNNAAGGGMFGNNNNNNGAGGFGASNNNTGGGLFGGANNANNNQAKPAFGGFGATLNTSGGGAGLFGNANNNNANTNTGTNLFGNAANNTSGGGLFGNTNNQNKPAGGGGLFGAGNTATNTGGGLFGANNASSGTNLFGNANNNTNNTSTSSLFGNPNNQNRPAGGGLFGNNANTTNNNSGGLSLFGNNTSNQNQINSGGSLFGSQNTANGTSMFSNAQGQQGNQLHAALTSSAYGNDHLFNSLSSPALPLGPLATPLANARATPKKTQSLLASVRMSTPIWTPRGSSLGRKNTYGLSSSVYGSPGSAYSMNLTPGASSMLKPLGSLTSGLASRLTKSMSANDLRDGSSTQNSLLRPSMLNPGNGRAYGSGSMRKLNIDRTLREDFFGTPKQSETPKPAEEGATGRRVIFDSSANKPEESTAEPSAANALVRTEGKEVEEASPQTNSEKRPEMEQVKENTTISASSDGPSRRTKTSSTKNTEPGAYYTKPSLDQLKKMSRQQLQKMGGLTVGRENVGKIEFGPCDLSSILLDQICGEIVQLETRAATVYPDIATKPNVGRGLNVPATISLEKSWPRKGPMKHKVGDTTSEGYHNHVNHLKRIGDTKFIEYDSKTGIWKFSVEHFTTYGLDDEDEELPHEVDSSALSDLPDISPPEGETTIQSIEIGAGDIDDTFEFKLDQRQSQPPGGFGISFDYDDPSADEEMPDEETGNDQQYASSDNMDEQGSDVDFASSGGPVQAVSSSALVLHHGVPESEFHEDDDVDPDMPGSFIEEPKMPRSILKPTMGVRSFPSPEKLATEAWEEQLQRTLSPRKRDRQALKDMQQDSWKPLMQENAIESRFKQSILGQSMLNQSYLAQKSAKKGRAANSLLRTKKSDAFRTSMDIMNSLWDSDKLDRKASASTKAFEYPYAKKSRFPNPEDLNQTDIAFHDTMKPSFTASGMIVYSAPGSQRQVSDEMKPALRSLVGEHKDVRFATFVTAKDLDAPALLSHYEQSQIHAQEHDTPSVRTPELDFAVLADTAHKAADDSALNKQELSVWRLCSILYDDLNIVGSELLAGVPDPRMDRLKPRAQLDAFAAYWAESVGPSVSNSMQRAKSGEEKALFYLTYNNTVAACEALSAAKNFKLAMMVSQLSGTGEGRRKVMSQQIKSWRERKDWSEMSDVVRTLYSILAGQVCTVQGQAGAAEDKASEFCIARRFNLSWQQSFGLRVFFGGHTTLEGAITAYADDLETDREAVYPTTLWDSVDNTEDTNIFADKEDTLMTLLRLYIDEENAAAELLEPLVVSGSALNSRLTWQMATLLQAKNICELTDGEIDMLTLNFAAELESAGDVSMATWVLLHLQISESRTTAISGLLQRQADRIATPDVDTEYTDEDVNVFSVLTQDLCIPPHMIFAARAPFAKSLGDDARQVYYLLRAEQAKPNSGYDSEAQEVICKVVGPGAIISKNYKDLRRLLQLFTNKTKVVQGWPSGAGVYNDFLRLVSLNATQKRGRDGETAVKNVKKGLADMQIAVATTATLTQRVAMLEMTRVCEEFAREIEGYTAGTAVYNEDIDMEGNSRTGVLGFGGEDALTAYRHAMGIVV